MRMKKIGLLTLAVSMALFAGCGAKKNAEEAKESGAAENTVSENSADTNADEKVMPDRTSINVADFITLGGYKGIAVSASPAADPSEEDVEIWARQTYFDRVISGEEEHVTNRPVALYDMTNIDYCGKKDGVAFDGGTAQGASLLIGSGQFIGGFEEGLIGVMPGDTVDLNLTFPEAYGNAELAGQDVVFTVTVNYIEEMSDSHVAELDADGAATLDEFYGYVRNYLVSRGEESYRQAAGTEIWQKVISEAVYADELPQELMDYTREVYKESFDRMAAYYGVADGKTLVESQGDDYEATLDELTVEYVKDILAVWAIADAENIQISDAEIDAEYVKYAADNNATVEELAANGIRKGDFGYTMLYNKVGDFLVENAAKQGN